MLSDCDISNEWEKHKVKLKGWDYGGTEVMYEGGFEEAVRAIESAATTPLLARIAELEKLCDEAYVAQGADAYNNACDEMERWQKQRKADGKEVGTTGSLCDGIAWLYLHVSKLERELEEARKDAEMLDWLDNNIFVREPDEWDQRYGVCRDGKTQMWAIFAPKGVHGSARKIIDAAIKEQT